MTKTYYGYLVIQPETPGKAGSLSRYMRRHRPHRNVVKAPGLAEDIYEGIGCLPWRNLGVLVAGLKLSPRGDWLECNPDDVPYGVLAWPVGDAIQVRSVRGRDLETRSRDCVLIGPAHRTPYPADDVADLDGAWLTWLGANLIVLPAENPNAEEHEDVADDCWCLAVSDLAHMSFLRNIMMS